MAAGVTSFLEAKGCVTAGQAGVDAFGRNRRQREEGAVVVEAGVDDQKPMHREE